MWRGEIENNDNDHRDFMFAESSTHVELKIIH